MISFDVSPLVIFLNVFSKRLSERMQSHISCICFTSPHCVFENVPSKCQLEKLITTLIAFVWLGKSRFHIHMHNLCIFKSLSLLIWNIVHCISNVSQTWLPERKQSNTGCICLAFTGVHFQMSPQMTCLRGMRHSIQISDMEGQLGQSLISWEISTFSPLNLSVYIALLLAQV